MCHFLTQYYRHILKRLFFIVMYALETLC
jgi:hypothetical protein